MEKIAFRIMLESPLPELWCAWMALGMQTEPDGSPVSVPLETLFRPA